MPENSISTPDQGAQAVIADPLPSAESVRAHERWWQTRGSEWLAEVEARRTAQPQPANPEAFLHGFFLATGPVRVLDFGCGGGGHLRALAHQPHLELFGCDISPKLLDAARFQLTGVGIAPDRLKQIVARGRLPYPDGFFDVVYTSEVLVHVDPLDVTGILRELMRVSRQCVLHVENAPTSPSRRDSGAYEGSWLHDFKALYAELGIPDLVVLPGSSPRLGGYLAVKPGAAMPAGIAAALEPTRLRELSHALDAERTELTTTRAALHKAEQRVEALEYSLERAERSPTAKALSRLRLLPLTGPAVAGVDAVAGAALALKRAVTGVKPEEPDLPELTFEGIATRASRTAEQFRAAKPKVISACHPDWRGIRGATYGQNAFVLEIPGIVHPEQIARTAEFLRGCGTEVLAINGFPPKMEELVLALHQQLPELKIALVYHGPPALREDAVIQKMLDLVDAGAVWKLGFVKSGFAEFFRALGYPAEHVMNVLEKPIRPMGPALGPDGRIHLGVFSPDVSHKNVATQLVAAMMIPDAVIHVCEFPPIDYLQRLRHRVVVHGILPHAQFQELLPKVQASLYVSLLECYPMTVLESLAAGTVCLTSHTSRLFDDSPELFDALVVPEHDNPHAIAQKLTRALDMRETLVPKAQKYLSVLNARAQARWNEFIES